MSATGGSNIAKVVDVLAWPRPRRYSQAVAISRHYRFMCSDPGQEMIARYRTTPPQSRCVAAAAVDARTHVRKCVETGGINRYFFEMANIREQVSWVTVDQRAATRKRPPFYVPRSPASASMNLSRCAGYISLERLWSWVAV